VNRAGKVSLDRALSKLGLASRSEARRLVIDGRVRVDGRIVGDPDALVVPERIRVTIDGARRERPAPLTIMLHKPRGVVTTRRDPEGRPTAFGLVAEAGPHLVAVGRLDLASSGLLIFTNDTRLASELTDRSAAVRREYIVTVRGAFQDDDRDALEAGIVVDDEPLRASAVVVLKRSSRETHVRVTLHEGRNREIRRLMRARGYEVTRLLRVAFGSVGLGTLQPGRWRALRDDEVQALRRDAQAANQGP
jgi:23S rRNA pseudouridine2605 synthase